MSPRPGGEADKYGNRYEGAWTVRHVLYVLMGRADSITVEDVEDLALGSEFTYRRNGAVEAHQLKRQNKLVNSWSVRSLANLEIWPNARYHVLAGREFHFVSEVPSRVLSELSGNARRSASLDAFTKDWLPNQPMRDAFTELSSPKILGSAETAWQVLRGTWIEWPDERELIEGNAALSGLLLDGADGRLAAAGLGDLVVHNLGVELTAAAITHRLAGYGLRRATAVRGAAITDQVNAVTAGWSAAVKTELLEPVIPRDEATELQRLALGEGDDLLVVVVGAAGGGKTGVLHQAVEEVQAQGLLVLAFRLDRLEPFASTAELGSRLGLEVSPVAALAAAAGERPSLLVIDQLDAVSLASGRMPGTFDVIAAVIREATVFPDMRVVMACRKFDVDNDERIRGLATRPGSAIVAVGPLTDAQVDAAVTAMGLYAEALTAQQRKLLQAPLHLVLLATVAGEPNALAFQTGGHLFDAYWDRKRRNVAARRTGARFEPVVSAVAEAISRRQRLSVPMTVLDRDDLANDADVLVSEHVLVRDGREIAFFHETFFDYAFARHWVGRDESLVDFLTQGEQELFRRAQVRQIITHLRDAEPDRFKEEVRALLASDGIRFHIKDAALAVLGNVSDPTTVEADLLLNVAASHPPYEDRLWSHLRTPAWFARLDADGQVGGWLRGGEVAQTRALTFMTSAGRTSPDRLAELVAEHREAPTYPAWLRWVAWRAPLPQSRRLFDLFLEAIRQGQYDGFEHDLWLSVHGLAEERPDWAVEVLAAFLLHRADPFALTERGKVRALEAREYEAAELVRQAAAGAPRAFTDTLLPYVLQVIAVTAYEAREGHEGPLPDAQYTHRFPGWESDTDLDDVLLAGLTSAIRALVAADPRAMRATLERLAGDPHDTAQWLLYQGLVAGGAAYAEWAAELLLEEPHRLLSGNVSNVVWMTREVLQAISPHVSEELFGRLEAAVRDLRFSWEARRPGWYAFNLLSALDEGRLSEVGRRRLLELRRASGMQQPSEPAGVTSGTIGSPIAPEAARHMKDNNWLKAMATHASEREDFRTFTGGAVELSRVLREETKLAPDRFARLALQLTPGTNPAYGDAILMGLGDAEPIDDEGAVFDAIRHIASFGHDDNDRWLGWALRPYVKTTPIDMVELITERLAVAADPGDDGTRVWSDDGTGRQVADIRGSGINTARGSLAEALANLLVFDSDGARTEVVAPLLNQLAADPSVPVRSCVARLIGAAMRHARQAAIEAFWQLIETDDNLLATDSVLSILVFLGNEEPDAVRPVIERMLASDDAKVREAGGEVAAFAAMEWSSSEYLDAVLIGSDAAARQGAASTCALRLPHTDNTDVAVAALAALLNDGDDGVRKEAAVVAGVLRGHALGRYDGVLTTLIASPAYADALPQLLITLERAPDQVNHLVLLCARRFVEALGPEAGDIRTSAAGDAHEVSSLIIRGMAQARTAAERSALLDVLDQLLMIGAYGVDDVISASERSMQ
ncbi:hypothetical protein SAMN05660464_3766 [Geodermatophilus dictyosporus]|uniref:ATPase family associated with various cellular activities (AAA) n=1 Tax=Geodermatophilus dictyosporus TaxID=1523247 RepID=A0A1I5RX48_9ACTN|nr:hypothetical protein [Geodermatophilus dictyosporus]SFP63098.1 hypothetical protein SAMN05660464_3766 [Geodermatophilus dictyosporus]